MFCGIVLGAYKITGIKDLQGLSRITVDMRDHSRGLQTGASVAINGVCLTATRVDGTEAVFEMIQETLNRTNLGNLVTGDAVNVERAMRIGDEIGGHQVTGHIDCTGMLSKIVSSENNRDLEIRCDPDWMRYLVPKGWIAIDGISLTVVDVGPDWFSVSLIPETLQRTVIGRKTQGDAVNLEFDHTTKVIVHTLENLLPGLEQQILTKLQSQH